MDAKGEMRYIKHWNSGPVHYFLTNILNVFFVGKIFYNHNLFMSTDEHLYLGSVKHVFIS